MGIPKESLGDKNRRLQADFANKGLSASVTPAVANIGGTPPVAPVVAPAPTISPTSPITKQDYSFMGADNSPIQADIAPAVPPSSVATAQAPIVAPTTIEAPKTETLGEKNRRQQAEFAQKTQTGVNTPDFNTSQGREQDILKNLNEGFTNAPSLFQNQESYRQAYGYDTADQGKKAILDSFFAGKQTPTDSNSLYSQLSSGVAISDPRVTATQEYKNAIGRLDKVNTIKGYDQSQISTLLAEGKLVPGTQIYKDLSSDPATLAKITNAQKINVINKVPTSKEKVLASAAEAVIDETPLGQAFKDGFISAEEADSFTRTPEIVAKQEEADKKGVAYDSLKAEYDDMENTTREELKGKGASEGYIQSLVGERQKNIFKRLQVLGAEYNRSLGAVTDLKTKLADTFKLNVDLYKDQKAGESQNARDEKTYENQKEMVALQQAYQNPDINSTNPQIAQIATQKLIEESLKFAQTNGVPVTRNSGAILADAKAYAQRNGVSLAQAIQDTFTVPLTEKPEYQAALDNIRSKNEPAGKLQVIGERIDPTTGTKVNVYGQVDKSGNIVEYNTGSQATDSIENFTTTRRGSTSVQCGELVNDYWKSVTGSTAGIGDTLESKLATVDKIGKSDTPVVGGIFVSNPLGNTVGHTGIIQQVNSDGSIVVREANARGSANGQPPVSKTYTAQQAQNMAFSMPPAKKEQTSTGVYSDGQLALMQGIPALTKETRIALKGAGLTDEDWGKFNDGQLPPTNNQRKTATGVIEGIDSLLKLDGLEDAVGFSGPLNVLTFGNVIPGTDRADFIKRFDSFRDNLVLPNLGQLKGPMSDKDIQFLKNTATSLNLDMSEKTFKDTLAQLKSKYTEIVNKGLVNGLQDNAPKTDFNIDANTSDADIIKFLQSN